MLQSIAPTTTAREHIATVTSKGQITIPASVRKHLKLKATSKLAFVVDPKGNVQLKAPKYPTLESIFGAVKPIRHIPTLAEIREERSNNAAERALKSSV